MSDEVELEFRRFSKEKQEQVRQLVAYTTLMGLNGKDLVSIGGKLDRIEQRKELERKLHIVRGYDIKPIGRDKKAEGRFKLQLSGVWYHFANTYNTVQITNQTTKKVIRQHYNVYSGWGRVPWRQREVYHVLWALHEGKIKLP